MHRTQFLLSAVVVAALGVGCYGLGQTPVDKPDAKSSSLAAPTKLPEWDVVSVKQADPNECNKHGSGLQPTPDGIHIYCVSVLNVIQQAFRIPEPSRIVGAPEWTKGGLRWDIDAKVASEDVAAWGRLSRNQWQPTLRPLLEERFSLKAHLENREIPVYELVVAKGGTKLKEASPDEVSKAMMMGGTGKIKSVDMSLGSLPPFLNNEVGRPVVDKTGLTGKYSYSFEYVPVSKAATDETGGPSVFTAIEEQLGLKLEPAKEMMDVLVVDSIGQPVAN